MLHRIVLVLFFSTSIAFSQENTQAADVPFAVVNHVPIYPGCQGSDNEVLKKCMSDKIAEHVAQHFNFELAKSLNLKRGKHRVGITFKIDKEGVIANIEAVAPNEALEKEGIRVISLLPNMKPGRQRGEAVGVLYGIPILFEIEKSSEEKKKKTKESAPIPIAKIDQSPIYPGCENSQDSEAKKCTQDRISTFVKDRFNTRLFRGMNLNEKRIKMYVLFTIDANGNVKDIKTRAPHPKLEKEAKKAVILLPRMTPGKSKGVPVETSYALPLLFVLG